MADSAQTRSGLTALLQDHLSTILKNTLFNRMPLLYFLFGKDGDKTGPDGLGRPKSDNKGVFLSGVQAAKARRESILGALVYEPIIQVTSPAPSDGKNMGMRDTLPSRADWTNKSPTSYFQRPRFKWCEYADPYKVPNKDIETTKQAAKNEQAGWTAVGSLYTAETTSALAVHCKRWNDLLWGATGTGYPTSEDAEVWDNIHSIQQALRDDNTYGGLDRSLSANSWWRGKYVTAATPAVFEDLINDANYTQGLADKGLGLNLLIVGNTLFRQAKMEAKAKGALIINNGGIPEFGQFGFSREIVRIDNTWIVSDPTCPAKHVAGLNLDTWTFAIRPSKNFVVTTPFDQSQIEGGDDAMVGYIRTELMLACEVPSANIYWTNVG